jgi:hypothetical protein
LCDTLLEGLAQDFQDMACELGQFIQEAHAVVCQQHFLGHQHPPPADQPHIRNGVVGAPVRPATRGMRVVSRASGSVMAGRMVGGRRASIDLPAPRGPSSRTFGSQRLHRVRVHLQHREPDCLRH